MKEQAMANYPYYNEPVKSNNGVAARIPAVPAKGARGYAQCEMSDRHFAKAGLFEHGASTPWRDGQAKSRCEWQYGDGTADASLQLNETTMRKMARTEACAHC